MLVLFILCLMTFKILFSSDILVHHMVGLLIFSLSTFANICVRGKFMFFSNNIYFNLYNVIFCRYKSKFMHLSALISLGNFSNKHIFCSNSTGNYCILVRLVCYEYSD